MNLKQGDLVWTVGVSWTGDIITCPVCNGTSKVLVKPIGTADSEGSAVVCDYCTKYPGWSETPGRVTEEWSWKAHVRKLQIDRVIITEDPEGQTREYHANVTSCSWTPLKESEIYPTREAAEAAGARMVAEQNAMSELTRRERVDAERKKMTWSARYHQRQVAELLKRVEYHDKILGKIKERKDENHSDQRHARPPRQHAPRSKR